MNRKDFIINCNGCGCEKLCSYLAIENAAEDEGIDEGLATPPLHCPIGGKQENPKVCCTCKFWTPPNCPGIPNRWDRYSYYGYCGWDGPSPAGWSVDGTSTKGESCEGCKVWEPKA
jgi:hypothetical protein